MITYAPLWRTLQEKNISTYKLEREYHMSKSMIHKLKHDKSITLNTLNELCRMFQCGVSDIIEYVDENA